MAIEITESVRTGDKDVKGVYVKVIGYKVDTIGKVAIADVRCFESKEKSTDTKNMVVVNKFPTVIKLELNDTQVAAANHRKVIYEGITSYLNELGYANARID